MLKYHIQTIEVGSGGASSISFNSIPQIYDDLVLVLSGRSNSSGQPSILYRFNNSSSGYSSRILAGYTSGVTTGVPTTLNSVNAGGDWGRLDYEGFNYSASTANTFSNIEFRIPNYKSNSAKAGSADIAVEDVSASPLRWWLSIVASLWTGTQPINSVSFALHQGSFAQYSSASLYGIKRGSDGKTDVAAGGVITQSGGYTIHTFNTSGTFVANRDLEVEYLVVAGGGGADGGGNGGVAGGAGGYRTSVAGQTSGAGSTAEPKLQLSSNQSFLVQVGSGGAGSIFNSTLGASGSASSFASIISLGGGRHGLNGGSGGGGGLGTTEQGFNGGLNYQGGNFHGGGGGGAGALGGNSTSSSAGNGGAGVSSNISGVSTTRAGGGGGGTYLSGTAGTGGTGGGGNGSSSGNGQSGTANTGGGGGGSRNGSTGGNGGSGVVIIRYLTPA